MAIAPSAGIYIHAATGNFSSLFWIALALALAGFCCASSVKIPQREIVQNKPKISLDHFFLGRAWLMAINICLFGLCWGVMSNYVAIYGKEELGITDGTGIFFAILSFGLFSSRLYGSRALRAGQTYTKLCHRRNTVACRLHAFRPLYKPVDFLRFGTFRGSRQRTDVSRLPKHVYKSGAP